MKSTIVTAGEALWDLFPDGARFGGAPANVACHAASFGATSVLLSRLGDDDLGRQARDELTTHGVDVSHVQCDTEHETGTVAVSLDLNGVPGFAVSADVAWDYLEWSDELENLAALTDAVCFGSLGQRCEVSRSAIQRFVASTPTYSLRVFDVNLRPPFFDRDLIEKSMELANVLKISDEELPKFAEIMELSGSPENIITGLLSRYQLDLVALTRGPNGALLIEDGRCSDFPGFPASATDTVGAGDSFTATLIYGLLQGYELDRINRHACEVAAFVCSKDGAIPTLPEELCLWMS